MTSGSQGQGRGQESIQSHELAGWQGLLLTSSEYKRLERPRPCSSHPLLESPRQESIYILVYGDGSTGITDKQGADSAVRITSVGLVSFPPFIWAFRSGMVESEGSAGGGWGDSAETGAFGSPRRPGFQSRVSHRGGRTWFCFGFGKGLAAFFQCWFNETQNCFS